MTRSFVLAATLAAALAPTARAQNPLAAPDPWTGAWLDTSQGGPLRVTVVAQGAAYGGTVELRGQRYPLAATAAGGRLDGTFEVQGVRYAVALAREGDVLVLTTDGMTYRLRREASQNPLTAGPAPASPAAGASAIPEDWQRWRHPLGYELRFPPGWQMQETQLGYVFSAPDLARDALGQPQELTLMQGVPAQGVTRPDDPRAVQFIETSMRTVFPFLRRTGEVVRSEVGGRPVAELRFTGTTPQGKACDALSLIMILGDQSVLGHYIGEPSRFAQREPILRQIFGSCGETQAERDQRLVGTWSYVNSTTSRDFSSTNVTTMTLAADGRFVRSGQFAAGATQRQDGQETGRTLVDTGDVNRQTATWAGGGGKLIVRWPDGTTEQWTYELSGNDLLLKGGNGEPRLYQR